MKTKFAFFEKIKKVPWWVWLCGIASLLVQSLFYYLSNFLTGIAQRAPICTKIDWLDDALPIIPIFAIVYVYAFVFWFCAPASAYVAGKDNFYKFIIGQSVAYFIGFIIFVCLPTYMDRSAEGILAYAEERNLWLLKTIYNMDGGKMAFNLFPSYHCLTSVYSYLAVRKQKNVSLVYRIYALCLAILVCIATLAIKQHYFLDFICGTGIAIVTYIVVNLVYNKIKKDKGNGKNLQFNQHER